MKNRNMLQSFSNAIWGVVYAVRHERNMKIHVLVAVAVLFLSVLLKISKIEFMIVCITIGLVMVCELFNTAIEAVVDIAAPGYHDKAKVAKDVAAGAVMVSAAIAVVVGYSIFFEKLRVFMLDLF